MDQMAVVALRALADTEMAISGFLSGPELAGAVYSGVEKLSTFPPRNGTAG